MLSFFHAHGREHAGRGGVYLFSAGTAFGATPGAGKLGLDDPLCASQLSLCADAVGPLNGYYVGHDEPSLLFKSNIPGRGTT